MTASMEFPSRYRPVVVTAALALPLAVWAYWPTLAEMAWRWAHDPQYSHGYLVPAFAGYLLWLRRGKLARRDLTPSLLGLGLLAAAALLRLGGTRYHYGYLDQISLLPCLMGLATLAGGRAALSWSWPALAFLAFMVPLPHSASLALSGPMQTFATLSSTFLLQVLGRPAIAEGNLIQLNEIELGIVEACSGLRMLVVFFALSTAVAMLSRKPLWEKLVLAGSAVPIALASNVLRITITGICFEILGNGYGGELFHDVAGWLMMPLGLAFLGLELLILQKLLIEPAGARSLPGQGPLQRVEVSPAGLYRDRPSRRRRTVTPPAAVAQREGEAPAEPRTTRQAARQEPRPPEIRPSGTESPTTVAAAPEPAPESVAQA